MWSFIEERTSMGTAFYLEIEERTNMGTAFYLEAEWELSRIYSDGEYNTPWLEL